MIEIEQKPVEVTRELKRLGSNFAPQNQRLIGGIVATNSGDTRVEMTSRDNRLNIWKDGFVTTYLTESALVFQAPTGFVGGIGYDPSKYSLGLTSTSLYVQGTLYADTLAPLGGASGSFTSADGKTITVTDGIITNIV